MKVHWLLFACLCCCSTFSLAQTYQPNWESLDTRPVPQWFKDAKFGIFIHWGVYSVPAYTPKGNYAEWYQHWLVNKSYNGAVTDWHQQQYGNTTYYQLASQFKAELFDPEAWAKLFEQSGAKYIVLTSKHHDGFCLWPSKEADKDWGFPWNAVTAGPKRDLIGDLFKAVAKTSVKPGLYFSLYEWYNPLWLHDKDKYVAQHEIPQMKDLIKQYHPYVLWTDGEWEMSADQWKSKPFLAWLYNSSSVKDSIVVNDRWGKEVRFHHAGFFTPEYQPDLEFDNHYWEESRGIGYSYGYNRTEDAWDYNTAQSLVLQLVDKVSRGGNFLLDIGPDAHGKIPPIMQERLLSIGQWLKLNGEAIYNTTRWRTAFQWSEGKTTYKPARGEDPILKSTINPNPGYAVKEVFYTYNGKNNNLYAILPRYPDNNNITLKKMHLPEGTALTFLATGETLHWENTNSNVVVHLPQYNPNKITVTDAYVIKIAGYGRFVHKPQVQVSYPQGKTEPVVTITGDKTAAAIHYTTDGTLPTEASPVYKKPFTVKQSATVQAIGTAADALTSFAASDKAVIYNRLPPIQVKQVEPGVRYQYFETDSTINFALINNLAPKTTGIADNINVVPKERASKFALYYTGYINIPADNMYSFYTVADDGCQLSIDENIVVDDDGNHTAHEATGKIALKKGYHAIKVLYYDAGGDNELNVFIQAQGQSKIPLPNSLLYHAP
ncbi:alpha-L-fucosidase [Deminuibacter soli]|uniref:alpha-L-fucosidase n=1 Tax=Deminuibacter soli TaxID=2291815 RepID=A0A3E1NKW5_9BACT|nr:alpha-L-fucosidase [Deminuibacter soli]RFM28484.1 hypothetical protein DXN05_06665 [Deminuibacter soli]